MALEPRWLFDGAGAVTADAALADAGPGAGAFAASPGHDGGQHARSAASEAHAGQEGGGAHQGRGIMALTTPAEPAPGGTSAATPDATADATPDATADASSAAAPVSVDVAKGSFDSAEARDAAVASGGAGVRDADAGNVDAGDNVYFAVQVRNTGADAWDVRLVDTLPPGMDAGDVTGLSLHDAAGNPIDISSGTVLRDAGSGEPITDADGFAQALFGGDGVEFIDPSAGEAFFSTGGCGTDGVTVRYQIQVPDAAVAGSVVCAQAEVTHAAASECGPNAFDCGPLPGDSASISIAGADIQTEWIATSAEHTDGNGVAIGEVATYRTTITVPEGTSPGAVVIHDLAPGLTLVSVDSITLSDGLSTSRVPDPGAVDGVDAAGGRDNRFTIDFGTVTNANRDNCATETIVIEFRARAENVESNQQDASLGARADFSSRESDCGDVIVRAVDSADPLVVVEPRIGMTIAPVDPSVTVGEVASFEIRVTNDGSVAAFDVQFDDLALPQGMVLVPGSFVQVSGPAFDVPAAWAADGQAGDGPSGARLGPGETAVFRVQAVVAGPAPGEIAHGEGAPGGDASRQTLPATVRFTSLPGPVGPGERTGSDGRGGLNDYVAEARGQVAVAVPPVGPPVGPPVEPPIPGPPPGAGSTSPVLDPVDGPPQTWPDLPPPPLVSEVPGEGRIEPVALAPLVEDPWLVLKALPAEPAKPVIAPDDDCAPLPEPPKVIKRAPLGEFAGKPAQRSFSEQIDSAKKRFRPPAVIKAAPRDC